MGSRGQKRQWSQITGLAWCTPVSCHPRLHACEVSVDA
eukprot:CAMPEP_0202416566 /NCGR_PEP_ID=MMETSP1128-20130828/39969_1 /ASSEMBLY_ACC=CAM_ASM_000463 /TAXON_ID=3047 /ORGANISM="Dunaliella tertiolecta, Strain CCMP1320" /LENGTH=37 /DNA_ID= /DNA_START= /DNA_END= /DNA_ORIENTATION=